MTETFDRLLGDLNGDGTVDANDNTIVLSSLGMVGTNLQADADGSGTVALIDVSLASIAKGHHLQDTLLLDD